MGWVRASLIAACLAGVLPACCGTSFAADQATESKATEAKPPAGAKAPDDAGKPALSKGEIRRLEAKCSDEADAKHLHGDARRAFRTSCKNRGGLKPA